MQISHMSGRNPNTQVIFTAFPRPLARRWAGSKQLHVSQCPYEAVPWSFTRYAIMPDYTIYFFNLIKRKIKISVTGSLSQFSQKPDLDQSKVENTEFNPGLFVEGSDATT